MRSELAQLGTGAQALVIQILGDADDAQDGVHDAFETALGRPGAYDVRKGPLKPCVPARGSQPLHRMPVDELEWSLRTNYKTLPERGLLPYMRIMYIMLNNVWGR